jgi:hypothetical protein
MNISPFSSVRELPKITGKEKAVSSYMSFSWPHLLVHYAVLFFKNKKIAFMFILRDLKK